MMNCSFFRYGKGKIASQLAEIRTLYCGAVTLSLSEDLGFWVTILNKCYCVLYEMRLHDSVMSD